MTFGAQMVAGLPGGIGEVDQTAGPQVRELAGTLPRLSPGDGQQVQGPVCPAFGPWSVARRPQPSLFDQQAVEAQGGTRASRKAQPWTALRLPSSSRSAPRRCRVANTVTRWRPRRTSSSVLKSSVSKSAFGRMSQRRAWRSMAAHPAGRRFVGTARSSCSPFFGDTSRQDQVSRYLDVELGTPGARSPADAACAPTSPARSRPSTRSRSSPRSD